MNKEKNGLKFLGVIVLLVIGVGIFFYYRNNPQDASPQITEEFVPIKKGNLRISFDTEATILKDKWNVDFEISGIVKSVKVNLGDKVKKGQVLATLDDEKLKKEVEQAKYNFYKAIYERNKFDKETQYESWAAAQQVVNTTKIGLDLANYNLQHAKLLAPVSGVVTQINIKPHQVVSTNANTPAIVIATDDLNIISTLDDTEIVKVYKQMPVILTSDILDNPISAEVYFISSVSNSDNDGWPNYEVRLKLKNSKDSQYLLDGMVLDATFITKEVKDVMYVPVDAIIKENNKTFIYVLKNNIPEKVEVQTGFTDGKNVEITGDVTIGDKVKVVKYEK